MNLILPSDTLEAPTEYQYLRYLLMVTKFDLDLSNIVECDDDIIDGCFHFLKRTYCMEFVSEITSEPVEGHTLPVTHIDCQNVNNVIENIRIII